MDKCKTLLINIARLILILELLNRGPRYLQFDLDRFGDLIRDRQDHAKHSTTTPFRSTQAQGDQSSTTV